jgi:hypothetical protein
MHTKNQTGGGAAKPLLNYLFRKPKYDAAPNIQSLYQYFFLKILQKLILVPLNWVLTAVVALAQLVLVPST